jgi:FkbM family methyltransferase
MFDRLEYIKSPIPIEKELTLLFDQDKPLVIFEVGACEGEDSVRYSRLFKNSKIYTFEPLAQNVEIIKKNISKYNIENVEVHNKALSLNEGTAEFYVSSGRPENAPESDWDYGNKSSSLLLPDKHREMASFIEFNKKIIVETTTLAAFCVSKNICVIDYMHIDVQGAELMVLQGAGAFINSIKAIWLEVSKIHLYKGQPLVDEVKKFMVANNFVLAKSYIDSLQGDQLYISKAFFPDHKNIVKKLNKKDDSLIKRIVKKLRF